MWKRITLRWWRDRPRGQEAADDVGADQDMDGTWPRAVLECSDREHERRMWLYLLSRFGVNAMGYYES